MLYLRSIISLLVISCTFQIDTFAQSDTDSFKSHLSAFFSPDEVDAIVQFARSLDTFNLRITANSDPIYAYKSIVNLLSMHRDYSDFIALETIKYINDKSSYLKSLIWMNGIGISPVGKAPDVTYHLMHHLEIPMDSRFGRYLAQYLKARDFTFYRDYLDRWRGIGEPIHSSYLILLRGQNEFDFSRSDDRFFISIYFLTFFYNAVSNSETLLDFRTQNIKQIMAEVNARRRERGLKPRNFEADRRRLQNQVAVQYRLKH